MLRELPDLHTSAFQTTCESAPIRGLTLPVLKIQIHCMLLPSIRSLKTGSLLLAAVAAAALPAFAGDTAVATSSKDKNPVIEKPATEPRFYVDLMAGGEFDSAVTSFISNGFGSLPATGRGAIVPSLPGAPLGLNVQARDFSEAHDPAVINGRLELGYKIKPYLSLFVGFTYSHAGGDSRADVGFVQDSFGAFGTARNYALYAGVGQYQAFAGRAGFKVTTPRTILNILHIPQAIKPYASFSAGGKHLDEQNIRFFTDDRTIVNTGRYKLYDDSWVFSVEGNLGYDLQLTRNIDVILESGYGYDTAPDSGSLPIAGGNRVGSRVYSTVSLGAKLSF